MPDDTDSVDAIVSGALGMVLTRRPDSDVTVAVGGIMVDVIEVAYDERRDKFILHLHAEDLAEAVHKLTVDGSAIDQAAERAAGKEQNHENHVG